MAESVPSPGQFDIILVNTRHAGNIGAAARVMKNLGASRLTLVNPTHRAHLEAVKMAPGAEEIIENARIEKSLKDALAQVTFSYAATRRIRRLKKPVFTPKEAADDLAGRGGIIGLVFGSEKFGLANDDAALCHAFITIPTVREYQSLNLAQSAAVILYELTARAKANDKSAAEPSTASPAEKAGLYRRMEETLEMAGFLKVHNAKTISQKLVDIFERAEMDGEDVKIMEGMFRKIRRAVSKSG